MDKIKIYKLVSDEDSFQEGGNISTGNLFSTMMGRKVPKTYSPPKNQPLKKIGEFKLDNELIVGESDYDIIHDMKKGAYTAYAYGDDLIIAHGTKKLTKNDIPKLKWKYAGATVGVDGGTFGFFDSSVGSQDGAIPIMDMDADAYHDGIILNTTDFRNGGCDEEDVGVMKFTGSGDGLFYSFKNGNTMALLKGR
jgi:hypothetical protein